MQNEDLPPGEGQETAPLIRFVCPQCEQQLEADADMVGLAIDCPECSAQLVVPLHSLDSEVGSSGHPNGTEGNNEAPLVHSETEHEGSVAFEDKGSTTAPLSSRFLKVTMRTVRAILHVTALCIRVVAGAVWRVLGFACRAAVDMGKLIHRSRGASGFRQLPLRGKVAVFAGIFCIMFIAYILYAQQRAIGRLESALKQPPAAPAVVQPAPTRTEVSPAGESASSRRSEVNMNELVSSLNALFAPLGGEQPPSTRTARPQPVPVVCPQCGGTGRAATGPQARAAHAAGQISSIGAVQLMNAPCPVCDGRGVITPGYDNSDSGFW